MAKKRPIAHRPGRSRPSGSRSPHLVSIAPESGGEYIAIDSTGQVWRGQVATEGGGPLVINWRPVRSEFLARSPVTRPRRWRGPEPEEEELEP